MVDWLVGLIEREGGEWQHVDFAGVDVGRLPQLDLVCETKVQAGHRVVALSGVDGEIAVADVMW